MVKILSSKALPQSKPNPTSNKHKSRLERLVVSTF